MLSQKVFKQGLKELEECFDNFNISENKLKAWYKYSKDLGDGEWTEKISNCIKGCYRTPTLADVLDQKEFFVNDPEYPKEVRDRAKTCFGRNPGCYQGDKEKSTCRWCIDNLRI